MKYKEKTLIGEGPNLSSIPELLGFGSKNPAVLLVKPKFEDRRLKDGKKQGTEGRTGLNNSTEHIFRNML
jgi:hypothetical protein